MVISYNKSLPYQILFGLCCAVPFLSNYELTFALWLFTICITFRSSYSSKFLTYALCFVLVFIIALLSTNYLNAKSYFIIRDITYLLKPFLGLLLGYQICRFLKKNVLQTVVYSGLGVSIIHVLVILKTYIIYHRISVALLRDFCGFFSDFEVFALIFVLFHKEFQINFSKKTFYILVAIIGFSTFMYLSRTNFIQFVVLYLGVKGYFVLNRRAFIAVTSVVAISLVLYSIVLLINPKRTGSSVEEFLYKIKVAPTEPFKTKVNVADYKDFNINYRSVEIIYTLKQVGLRGPNAMIFGSGLGSQVDLKQIVHLGDMDLRYISVLHNGFMTTYLKSGIIGVIILVFSIFLLFNQRKSALPLNQQINFLLVGTSVFLIVSNWVLMGYYFTQDSKSIIVGLLFAFKEINVKEQNEPSKLV
jgi:hypothetical protein